ncbi:MAG TPA: hypothetical protein DEG69_12665, partial [Flavobacteriaceae bacterium]|nr:hypothetical protein [Flavobacteriaceae bacterium]
EQTISTFSGGVALQGAMKDRYVFPIFNHKEEILGFTGRDLMKNSGNWRPKWKHIGDKSKWRYPLIKNYETIKQSNSVILLESVGDMLALWDCNIRNTIVTFGLELNSNLIGLLLRIDPSSVTIAFNNDEDKTKAGNVACQKVYKKLCNHFDKSQISIKLPSKNDFGDMNKEEISTWQKKIK